MVILVHAIVSFNHSSWTEAPCLLYVWCFLTFRTATALSLLTLSVDRVLFLRKPGRYSYKGSVAVKVMVALVWLTSGALGLAPIAGTLSLKRQYITLFVAHFFDPIIRVFINIMYFIMSGLLLVLLQVPFHLNFSIYHCSLPLLLESNYTCFYKYNLFNS